MKTIIKKAALHEAYPNGNVPAHEGEADKLDLIRAGFGIYGNPADYVRMDVPKSTVDANLSFHPIQENVILAALFEKDASSGYTEADVMEILRELRHLGGLQLIPVNIEGDSSVAFGFMAYAAADEMLNFAVEQGSDYANKVAEVLDDMEKETPDGVYDFCGVRTKLFR